MPPVPLGDMIDMLRDKVAGFNALIVRADGVASDYPTLPGMKLKNVTLGQFLQLLRASVPGLETQRIDGPQGPLYVIRINSSVGTPPFGGPPGGMPAAPIADQPQ